MKFAIITDTHWGVRNDSLIQHDAMKRFLDEVFFPRLAADNIRVVVHGGDLFDRRKYVNFATARRLREDFLDVLKDRNIDLHVILGNHDTYYKNTNELNALREVVAGRYDNIIIYEGPRTIPFGTTDVLMLPWICDDNYAESMEAIKSTKAQIAIGHLELAGFEMYRGQVNEHGDDPKIFDKFDLVLSGHYHTRSTNGNITYLGTPCQYTWSDYGDNKGFHIFDTETRELEFVVNPHQIFHKVFYDDLNKDIDEVVTIDVEKYQNCYVKVVVKNKTNPYWFDLVIDRIEKANVADLQVVDDHFHLDLEADSDIISEAEDTMSIIRKYISGMGINTDKKRVENIIQQLYNEAHEII